MKFNGTSRKGRAGSGHHHARKTAGCCCGPRMRWVMVSVSLAIVAVCIISFLTMSVPRVQLNDYVLASKHMQTLGLRCNSKLKWTRNCDGHGVRQDVYFSKFEGKACGQSVWDLNKDTQEPGTLPGKVHLVYKVFSSNASAHEYYEKFWGRHLYERLPPYLYTEVDEAISDRVGDERKAYYWHPKQVASGMPVPLQAARVPVHVICIFRQGPAFVRVMTDGYFAATNEKKLIQVGMSLSFDVARQVRRAMHKFTPVQQRFYDIQSLSQRHFFAGVQKVRSYTESMWTLYLKRIRNRLRNIAAFFTTHASSFNDFTAFLSQILEDVVTSKIQFWLVAVAILLLKPIQCSVTLQLSKAYQKQLLCKSCMRIHTRGFKNP
eukprot:scpid26731/ scgid2235/ 